MAEAVSPRPVIAGGLQVRSQGSPCEMCGGQSDTVDRFFSEYFRFPLSVSFQQCSIFINLAPTFYDCSI